MSQTLNSQKSIQLEIQLDSKCENAVVTDSDSLEPIVEDDTHKL
jgi:hypothetical protein